MPSAADLPEIIEIGNAHDGPRLAVIAGVHGDELEGVLAARRVVQVMEGRSLHGSIVVAAPAHPAAWAADARLGPDGRNLAREFPGDPAGSPTQRLADHLTREAITGADAVLDLHSAGKSFDMPLMAGYYDGSDEICRRSASLAHAFGAPLVWEHPTLPSGRSISVAHALGIPSVYVEGRGGGGVYRRDLTAFQDGVLRMLGCLGIVDALPPHDEPTVVRGEGDTDGGLPAPCDGFLVRDVDAGAHVHAGELLGSVMGMDGHCLADLRSPSDGVVMLVRRSARVRAGDGAFIVAEIKQS